jgi:hypothetical protein
VQKYNFYSSFKAKKIKIMPVFSAVFQVMAGDNHHA